MMKAMATDYNRIAKQYVLMDALPWRRMVEEHTFMRHIGDVRGLKVVDLACGHGYYTRRIRSHGAELVVGVDRSEGMIHLARTEEARAKAGITYQLSDVVDPGPLEDFDLVTSAWLLTYARTRSSLAAMCQGVARRVRSGGRFVGITTNNDVYDFPTTDYSPYGFSIELDSQPRDGATITWRFVLDGVECDVENYYLPNAAYCTALEDAGFRDIKFHGLAVSPEGERSGPNGFWDVLLERPPAMVIEAVKA